MPLIDPYYRARKGFVRAAPAPLPFRHQTWTGDASMIAKSPVVLTAPGWSNAGPVVVPKPVTVPPVIPGGAPGPMRPPRIQPPIMPPTVMPPAWGRRRPRRHRSDDRGRSYGFRHPRRRPHPRDFGPPVYAPPQDKPPIPLPPPPPVVTPPPVPVATGPICPSWGWMVRTNPDGSETVVRCAIGQPAPAGLHGLDGLFDGVSGQMQSLLGPNWMLYVGGAAVAYFLFFRKRR